MFLFVSLFQFTQFSFFLLFFVIDFRSETDVLIPTAPKRLFPNEPISYRNLTNQSQEYSSDSLISNNDWNKPKPSEFKNFPIPVSRNVMNINHGSAMVAILQDSHSSSSDEKTTHENVNRIQVLPFSPPKNLRSGSAVPSSISTKFSSNELPSEEFNSNLSNQKRDLSPAILTETINIGSEFR